MSYYDDRLAHLQQQEADGKISNLDPTPPVPPSGGTPGTIVYAEADGDAVTEHFTPEGEDASDIDIN